ncbi:MAG TPA: IclR family transcriptional regulator C-terminal domain-containing protein [Solirubrobacteraceae bacterium]|jgi:IclR family pca regulon transcriptional regulator|nr:IclR family transcriptional regulator C-terminal domain-containing protein [Solirubrobacteraceae bacterium]
MADERKGGQRARRRGPTPKPAATVKPSKPQIEDAADPRRSRSLEYGTAIMQCYSGEHLALGIADLAEVIGISRSTTHRYAMTLVALGYLEQDSKRKYRLSPRAADPGSAAIEMIRAEVGGRAVLQELRDELGHTVSMGVLAGGRVIYVHRLFGHRRGQFAIDRGLESGAHVPAYCTALGKVLIASLSSVEREQLLAKLEFAPQGPKAILDRRRLAGAIEQIGTSEAVLSDEEQLAGARSLAVLVPGARGRRTLAIDVTVPAATYSPSHLVKQATAHLKRAAKLIASA